MPIRETAAEPDASKSAVFIDGDWLSVAAQTGRIPIDYGVLHAYFKGRFGPAVSAHIYLSMRPKARDAIHLAGKLAELGFTVHEQETRFLGKSSIDVQLASDAMAMRPQLDSFALVSGDSDFVPLLQHMSQARVRTVLISLPLALSTLLRDAADENVNLESVLADRTPAKESQPGKRQRRPQQRREASPPPSLKPPTQVVIDKGEHLKPYLLIRKLLIAAKNEVVFIDPYLGGEVFELLECLPVQILATMITHDANLPRDLTALVKRCRSERRQIRVFVSRDVHDRYLRVDDHWWHSGHSFKDLGNKVSQLSRVEPANCKKLRDIEKRILGAAKELHPAPSTLSGQQPAPTSSAASANPPSARSPASRAE